MSRVSRYRQATEIGLRLVHVLEEIVVMPAANNYEAIGAHVRLDPKTSVSPELGLTGFRDVGPGIPKGSGGPRASCCPATRRAH